MYMAKLPLTYLNRFDFSFIDLAILVAIIYISLQIYYNYYVYNYMSGIAAETFNLSE